MQIIVLSAGTAGRHKQSCCRTPTKEAVVMAKWLMGLTIKDAARNPGSVHHETLNLQWQSGVLAASPS